MADISLDPYYVLQDKSEIDKEDLDGELKIIGTDYTYTHRIIWPIVLAMAVLHIGAITGLGLVLGGHVKVASILWAVFLSWVATEGAHMGAHRCFSHRAFKAKPLLKVILLIMQTISGQHSMYIWCRDHRLHHRYSDTDGDPHNSKRGMFYSHFGWLMTSRHPLCKKLRNTIDMSDLQQDQLVMVQYRHFRPLYFFLGFLLPVWLPMHFFQETFTNAVFVCFFLRYVYTMHVTACINSLAHKFGIRPYDKTIQPVETWFVSLLSLGEGWHNYHHAYPWDYKAAEIGMPLNPTASLIRLCASLGLAYDLKSVDPEMLHKRIMNKGDGTYEVKYLQEHVTAIGPLHPLNPSYRGTCPDPEIKLKVRMKP
ncbi:stearoyl-CoA desaturase-like [Ostrinia nubilalis]|uniref:stearoyl-CoA desaturase-like n=1 Tax=Ostrinia nubilalis TaxID=29057 RepID=UPI003082299B